MKLQSEVGREVETKLSDIKTSVKSDSLDPFSSSQPEVDRVGTVSARGTSTSLPTDDSDKDLDVDNISTDGSGRRQSIELAEVPHFPKDSVMLSSPRPSEDDSHHQPPPPFHDVKPEDSAEDSVFVKDARTEPLDPQMNNHSLPLHNTERESGKVDEPATDYLPSVETS